MSPVNNPAPATLEELRRVPILDGIPEEVLTWLLDQGDVAEHESGEVLFRTGDPIDHLWLLLQGAVDFLMDMNGHLVHYFTFSFDPPALGAGGLLPYSRMKASPGWSHALGSVRVLRLHRDHFRALEQLSPELVQRLIGTMTERARTFATRQLQEEKISALGKLAAGLAHELNNPAAAIQRTSTELSTRLDRNFRLTATLIEAGVTAAEVEAVHAGITSHRPLSSTPLPLRERMAKEDALAERLGALGIEDPEAHAEVLAERGVEVGTLDEIHRSVGPERFLPLMRWLCNLLESSRTIEELGEAAVRISTLVGAVKSHVHMDRSASQLPVDLHRGIEDTLTILNYKLRGKQIHVERSFDPALPEVFGYAGELNQLWMNLIDNAIDAMGEAGRLGIATGRDGDRVTVRVTDDGEGIPKEIQSRIFDPFFTTKKQGEGTGMGLDMVKQAVERHHGEIRLTSEPGRTEFLVTLPIRIQEGPVEGETGASA